MKRLVLLLLAIILLLSACGTNMPPAGTQVMARPMQFYYCSELSADHTGHDILVPELRDVGGAPSVEAIVRAYLEGPQNPTVRSPFPAEMEILSVTLENGLLTVDTTVSTKDASGIYRTVAVACFVKTMTQLEEVREIRFLSEGKPLPGDWSGPWDESDFLLVDDTATSNHTAVKLYFADGQERYLTQEVQTEFFPSEAELPAYIVRQLLEGPKNEANKMALPDGTRLLGIQVENGLCTVNFSEDFVRNRPEHHAGARLAVFSVVNSLTELATVERVRFLSAGREIPEYSGLDLTQVFYREPTVLGEGLEHPLAMDLNLYVPVSGQNKLAEVPVVIRRTAGKTLVADVMRALLDFEEGNSYENYIPEGTMMMAMALEGGHCRLTLSSSFALCDTNPVQARMAVRGIVATLCDLEGIDRVSIEIHNGKLTSADLSEAMTVDPRWILH